MSFAIPPAQYTVATLPLASIVPEGTTVYVTDAAGGACPAYSDGINWLRYSNNSIIAASPNWGGQLMSKGIPVYTTPPSSVWNFYASEGFPNIYYQVFTPDAVVQGAGGYGPGTAQIPAFQTVVLAAQAAGCKCLGYIATDYATRPLSDVFTAIDNFYAFYPTIDGLFFDTVADNQFDYYNQIRQHFITRARNIMVLNPGTATVESYMQICDVMLNYEDTYANYLTYTPPVWQVNYDMRRFWNLVHTCPGSAEATIAMTLAQQNWVGNVFITDVAMPYPWTPLSAYESEMTAYIEATAAPFSLINIPGRIGEWWADNVTKNGSNIVSVVSDHAAIAHNLTPPGTGPLWVANQLNGHPILRFTGSEYLTTIDWSVFQPMTVWTIYKATANDVVALGGAGGFGLYDESGSGGNAAYAAGSFIAGSINKNGIFAIHVAVYATNQGSSQLRINGVQSTNTQPGTFGFLKLAMGGYTDGTNQFQGDIYGQGVFRGALGPTMLANLEGYLSARTGITLGP